MSLVTACNENSMHPGQVCHLNETESRLDMLCLQTQIIPNVLLVAVLVYIFSVESQISKDAMENLHLRRQTPEIRVL